MLLTLNFSDGISPSRLVLPSVFAWWLTSRCHLRLVCLPHPQKPSVFRLHGLGFLYQYISPTPPTLAVTTAAPSTALVSSVPTFSLTWRLKCFSAQNPDAVMPLLSLLSWLQRPILTMMYRLLVAWSWPPDLSHTLTHICSSHTELFVVPLRALS